MSDITGKQGDLIAPRSIESSPVIRFHIRNAVGIILVLLGLIASALVVMTLLALVAAVPAGMVPVAEMDRAKASLQSSVKQRLPSAAWLRFPRATMRKALQWQAACWVFTRQS